MSFLVSNQLEDLHRVVLHWMVQWLSVVEYCIVLVGV